MKLARAIVLCGVVWHTIQSADEQACIRLRGRPHYACADGHGRVCRYKSRMPTDGGYDPKTNTVTMDMRLHPIGCVQE